MMSGLPCEAMDELLKGPPQPASLQHPNGLAIPLRAPHHAVLLHRQVRKRRQQPGSRLQIQEVVEDYDKATA
ncbi:hypothetical protein L596_013262 [Steinernema carpocapsae]|uniref:Uncharacterized protein n=1 Tax=Steinernema carpocapsae TaxID=34508 RepID=A0A4U5P0G4_STECR|nr:hypothetical protein L596_013262 [Steinernema carpocapsae]